MKCPKCGKDINTIKCQNCNTKWDETAFFSTSGPETEEIKKFEIFIKESLKTEDQDVSISLSPQVSRNWEVLKNEFERRYKERIERENNSRRFLKNTPRLYEYVIADESDAFIKEYNLSNQDFDKYIYHDKSKEPFVARELTNTEIVLPLIINMVLLIVIGCIMALSYHMNGGFFRIGSIYSIIIVALIIITCGVNAFCYRGVSKDDWLSSMYKLSAFFLGFTIIVLYFAHTTSWSPLLSDRIFHDITKIIVVIPIFIINLGSVIIYFCNNPKKKIRKVFLFLSIAGIVFEIYFATAFLILSIHFNKYDYSYLSFGNYEQDTILDDGVEPIRWHVISLRGNYATLISENCFEVMQCYSPDMDSDNWDWDNSSLKNWLNNEFLLSAFSDEERNAIISDELGLSMVNRSNNNEIITIPTTLLFDTEGYDENTVKLTKYAHKKYLDILNYNSSNIPPEYTLGVVSTNRELECCWEWIIDNDTNKDSIMLSSISNPERRHNIEVKENTYYYAGVRAVVNIDLTKYHQLYNKSSSE